MERVVLTKTRVEGVAPPAAKDVMLWDATVRGFGVRVHSSGRRTYVVVYRVGGGRGARLRKYTIGVHGTFTVEHARDRARLVLAEARADRDPAAARASYRAAPTIAEFADRFLAEHARLLKKPRSVDSDEANIRNHIKPLLGALKLVDVTAADIDRALADIQAGKTALSEKSGKKRGRRTVRGGPIAANRVLALLSTMFNKAEQWDLRPAHSNPCRYARKRPERKLQRFLADDELQALAGALMSCEASGRISPAAAAGLRLLLFTGARLSEILALRWQYIDAGRRIAMLPDSKTGPKAIQLSSPALAVLEALPRGAGAAPVLLAEDGETALYDLKHPWRRVRDTAKLAGVRLHDLRHTFASTGIRGYPLSLVGALLGHRNPQTTQGYAHLANDPLQAAAEAIGAHLVAAMAGESPSKRDVAEKPSKPSRPMQEFET